MEDKKTELAGSNHQREDVLDIQSRKVHKLSPVQEEHSCLRVNGDIKLAKITGDNWGQRLHLFMEVLSVTRLPFEAAISRPCVVFVHCKLRWFDFSHFFSWSPGNSGCDLRMTCHICRAVSASA